MYGPTISRWELADQEPHSRQRNSLLERILLYKLQVPGSESRKTWLSKNNRIAMKARTRDCWPPVPQHRIAGLP